MGPAILSRTAFKKALREQTQKRKHLRKQILYSIILQVVYNTTICVQHCSWLHGAPLSCLGESIRLVNRGTVRTIATGTLSKLSNNTALLSGVDIQQRSVVVIFVVFVDVQVIVETLRLLIRSLLWLLIVDFTLIFFRIPPRSRP